MNSLAKFSSAQVKMSLCFVIFLFSMSYAKAMEVVVATGVNDDRPYVYGSDETPSDFPGVTIDVLRLIEGKMDITFTIKRHPWKRVVHEVKNNKIDGGFHFSFKDERRSFVAYPIAEGTLVPDPKYSISNRSYVIYRLKGKSVHWDGKKIVLDSKKENIIGAIRGGSITDKIKKMGHELVEVNTDRQLLHLLLAKRIHAFIALENMIDSKIESLGQEEQILIEKSLPAVVNKPYYIGFSKNFYRENPKLVWKIWTIIDEIKRNGEMKKIFARYVDR